MTETALPIIRYRVTLRRSDFLSMLRLSRILYQLSQHPLYRETVYPQVPLAARFDPGHAAVMMGYDFHVGERGPRLIEVNTNAGGSSLALQTEDATTRERFLTRTLTTFRDDFAQQVDGAASLNCLVILDESPREQFLLPEMQAFAEHFEACGVRTLILDPSELRIERDGVYHHQQRVDMIYNRHCDFYLETPQLAGIRAAYLSGSVCLSPNPHAYGLLADKRRMLLWQEPQQLQKWGLSERQAAALRAGVPECFLLNGRNQESLWKEHKRWVYKPVDQFGSRGVMVGEKITRSRFAQLDPETTLCQEFTPPGKIDTPDGSSFKFDVRLYLYRERMLGLTARLYRGQVTNMRTEGGGFAAIDLV
ncbi:MAG: hypothetical protein C0624_09815 [Desulfuromonas sp.]|nr:MAG: hypothetical protein C0624_09815 [Desulfuromonas sp.]